MTGLRSGFPLAALAKLVGGFVAVVVATNLVAYEPTQQLPAVATPDVPTPTIRELGPARAADETRIFCVGASLTAGYPYHYQASYAEQLGAGLRAVFPDQEFVVGAHAKPALDSPKLADMVDELLRTKDPSLICVALGSNEFANRIFSGEHLLPASTAAWVADRTSRARLLWGLLPETEGGGKQRLFQRQLERWVLESRNGQPFFGALPVPEQEQTLLVARMRRSMRRISARCGQAGVPLVFLVAVYGVGTSWPWGISAGGLLPEVDAVVRDVRRGVDPALIGRTEALLARFPERADLHFVHGLLLRRRGEAGAALAALERARDRDTVPMHLTGAVLRAIRDEAVALERPCLELDAPFRALSPDGIQGADHYLDYGHLSADGHEHAAAFLAAELSRLGLLPMLPDGWEEPFRRAARQRVLEVPEEVRRLAPTNIAGADGNFAMLFGNFREGFYYLRRAYVATPHQGELAVKLLMCAFSLGERLHELEAGEQDQRIGRLIALHQALQRALVAGRYDAWLDAVIDGRPLDELLQAR